MGLDGSTDLSRERKWRVFIACCYSLKQREKIDQGSPSHVFDSGKVLESETVFQIINFTAGFYEAIGN